MLLSECFTIDGDVDMDNFLLRRRLRMEDLGFDGLLSTEQDRKKKSTTRGADDIDMLPPAYHQFFPTMSLSACYTEDCVLDVERYKKRRRMQNDDDHWADDFDDAIDKPKKTRSKKRPILARRTETGELEEIPPTQSMWYILYVGGAANVECKRFQNKFRRRFRMPYATFLELVSDAKAGNWFPSWMGCNCAGKQSSPIELMILGSLRYLGRGWTFDDLEEATAVGEESHRRFFHQFDFHKLLCLSHNPSSTMIQLEAFECLLLSRQIFTSEQVKCFNTNDTPNLVDMRELELPLRAGMLLSRRHGRR